MANGWDLEHEKQEWKMTYTARVEHDGIADHDKIRIDHKGEGWTADTSREDGI